MLRREKVEPAPIPPPRKREREPSPVFSLEDEEEGGGGEGGRISPLPPPPPDLRIPKLRKTGEQREERPRKRSGEPLTTAAAGAESKRPKPIQIE